MESEIKKLEVGMALYQSNVLGKEPREFKISKVGRKYFELEGVRGKYDIETMTYVTEYGGRETPLYFNRQDVFDNDELNSLRAKIASEFRDKMTSYSFKNHYSLEQMREIARAFGISNKE